MSDLALGPRRAANRRWCVLLLAVWLLCLDALAAPPSSRWQAFAALRAHSVLDGENGPALRQATTVAQDRRGRIWIGENTGAWRLDGDLVKRYPGDEVPEMAAGFTRAFFPLANGDVLLGGDREGVLRWHRETDRFSVLALAGGQRLSRINAIEPRAGGGAWIGAEQGLFSWDGSSDVLRPVDLGGGVTVDSPRIFDVQQMADGTLWIAAAPGLYRRDPGQQHFVPVQLADARLQQRLRTQLIWELAADARGRLWVGLMQQGVVVIEPDGSAHAPVGLDGSDGLHAGTTIRSFLAVDGQMWLGTDGQGVLAVAQGQARRLPVTLSAFLGGRNFHVFELIRARDGRVWAASDRGVFHLDPQPQGIVELDASRPGEPAYEQPNMVRALHVDGRGRLWLGMFAGVIQVLDPATGQRQMLRLPPPLDASDVVAIVSGGDGQVWVASNGVAVIDPDTLALRGGGALPTVPVQRYMAMAGAGQRIWLGGREGVLELDLHGQVLRTMADVRSGLRSNRVLNLAWQPGQLWVGTAEGLHRLDLASWQAQHVAVGSAQGDLPGNRFIASLATDAQQVLAGTLEGMSAAPVGSTRLPLLLPTQGKDVRAVIGDGHGGAWLAVRDQGIVHRDRSGQVRRFGAHAGLHPQTQVHGNGIARAADGTVFIAANSGVLMLPPALLQRRQPPPPDLQPQVVALHLDGEPVAPSQLPADGGLLRLPRTVERVALAFSALDYLAPTQRRYSYRLEGLDSRWIDLAGDSQVPLVLYSRLPVGKYTLVLRTTSVEYPGLQWLAKIALEVPPAWYQQRWVWALTALLLIGMVGAGVHWRLRVAHRRQRWLQRRVQESTAELRAANARLAQLVGEDALTGLSNRRRGFERLAELHNWRQRMPGRDCVVLMDLDHFKQTNDRYGHLGGDAVLRAVGELLRSQLRAIDIAARYGGEELLLVLVDADQAEGVATVERLSAALRGLVVAYAGQQIPVSASFGLALSDPAQPIEQWIERADAALYRAKRGGRGRVCVDQE